MKISELLKNIDYECCGIDGDCDIPSLSMTVKDFSADCALIIPGAKIPSSAELEKNNIKCIICGEGSEIPSVGIPLVRVKNPRLALAYAYSNFYGIDYGKMKIFGVTGTNGKTSTATFLAEALSSLGKVGFIGTGKIRIGGESVEEEYYSMTTPDPPLLYKSLKRMEKEGCFAVVMEVSSHSLALSKVDPIPFDYGIMTNLSEEHMDFHETLENYYQTKMHLFSLCKTAVFNVDNSFARRAFREHEGRKISCGVLFKADVCAKVVEDQGFDGVSYIYHGKNFSFRARLKTPGIYNVYNSMLAIAAATDCGALPCKVKEAISSLSGIEGRYEIIKDEVTVIIDYAHTEAAFENILKSIKSAKGCRPLTVIFGAGGERDRSKRPKMAAVCEKYADKIIITQDNSRGEDPGEIIGDIIRGLKSKSYRISIDRRVAIREAILSAEVGEVIALIGKGAEKYNIDKSGYHRFDEKEIIDHALRERKRHANKA